MRRWMLLAAKLYPRAWRERYSEEFEALLEDYRPNWREVADVMRGAVKMQIKMGKGYLTIVAAMAVAGAIVAGVVAFRAPSKYVSTAVVQMAPQEVEPFETKFLSRTFLTTLICNPKLGLYPATIRPSTMEAAVHEMQRDLRVNRVEAHGPGGATAPALRISFSYPDRSKARDVVAAIAAEAVDDHGWNAMRQFIWHDLWPHEAPPAPLPHAQLLSPASVPGKPVGPNRLSLIATGIGAGLLLGALVGFAVRRPKRALLLAGFALGGAAVGIQVALVVIFAVPDAYTSTATVLVSPPIFPERPSGAAMTASMDARFRRAQEEALNEAGLAAIVQDRRLDLYKSERAREPLEKVIETMRARDLVIRPLDTEATAPSSVRGISISFTYPDRYKAKEVVEGIVTRLVNAHFQDAQRTMQSAIAGDETRELLERHLGDNLEVIDFASLPQGGVVPGSWTFAAVGMGLGVLAGWLLLARRNAARRLQAA